MTTIKITEARNKSHVGKTLTINDENTTYFLGKDRRVVYESNRDWTQKNITDMRPINLRIVGSNNSILWIEKYEILN